MEALAAVADPTRRQILDMLVDAETTAGELANAFPVSRPAVSRHLRVREAGRRWRTRGRPGVFSLTTPDEPAQGAKRHPLSDAAAQRFLPSRKSDSAFSIRRDRVSAVFADWMLSTW